MSRARTFADLATASEDNAFNSNRNLVVNGEMMIHQRAATNTDVNHAVDRFKLVKSSVDTADFTEKPQDITDNDPFSHALEIDCSTQDTSIGAAELIYIVAPLEAQTLQHLCYGASNAKITTISFHVKSALTGTYGFTIVTQDGTARNIGATYTINSANTWEKKTITFVGDASATINNDNGHGVDLVWTLTAGSNYTSSDNTSWGNYSGARLSYGHTANIASSTDNNFYLTGVQWEIGSVATPFQHLSFADNLRRCQRYFCTSLNPGTTVADDVDATTNCVSIDMASNLMRTDRIFFPVAMASTPNVTCLQQVGGSGGSSGQWAAYISTTWTHIGYSGGNATIHGFCGSVGSTAGSQDGYAYWTHAAWKATCDYI